MIEVTVKEVKVAGNLPWGWHFRLLAMVIGRHSNEPVAVLLIHYIVIKWNKEGLYEDA
jgi:hypothetical protein